MPDFTMCTGITKTLDCREKHGCDRYIAIPDSRRQSWFSEAPIQKNEPCNSYIPYRRELNQEEV